MHASAQHNRLVLIRYALSLERKEAQERRAERKEQMGAFKRLLDTARVGGRSQWRHVADQLRDEPAYRALDKIDRLALFEEHVRAAELVEEQQKLQDREARRRDERLKRDAFRALLLREHREGRLLPRTRWKDLVNVLLPTPEYRFAAEQSGSTPAELFEDVLETICEEYERHRRSLTRIGGNGGFEIDVSTTLAQLEAAIDVAYTRGESGVRPPSWAVRTYLEDHLERLALERASRPERRDEGEGEGEGSGEAPNRERKKKHHHHREGEEGERKKKKKHKSSRHSHRSHGSEDEDEGEGKGDSPAEGREAAPAAATEREEGETEPLPAP